MNNPEAAEKDQYRRLSLLRSFLLFTRVMYKLKTGRDFIISEPVGNEPHVISICRVFMDMFKGKPGNVNINVPPGWGKSILCKHFIAWAMAIYPDCNFLYISYSHDLAASHTAGIKEIMMMPEYQKLFGVEIMHDTSAKDYFKTKQGGVVAAFGSTGSITGFDAGLPNLERFSGCVIIDDAHKPDEVHSDTVRDRVIRNFFETIRPRRRGANVPILFVGQRLHEQDLPSQLLAGKDGEVWESVVIKALADNGFARYPEVHSLEFLQNEQRVSPYVFASQYQQNPIPSGGGLFKKDDFVLLREEPKILKTFITCDTAETSKSINDATVFSFWGIYKIEDYGVQTELFGLHWIDCWEFRVEPRFLEQNFQQFYAKCLQHPVPPYIACIEKKSTGSTLISVLSQHRGIKILDIQRSGAASNKSDRFISMQHVIASRLISLPENAPHTLMCLNHMQRITANNSHAHDDICDSVYDAVDMTINRRILLADLAKTKNPIISDLGKQFTQISNLKRNAYAARN